jgi:hypothetical protein
LKVIVVEVLVVSGGMLLRVLVRTMVKSPTSDMVRDLILNFFPGLSKLIEAELTGVVN